MPTITIYTDGSALGNPGPGGYGAVLLSGQHRKELSQGFRLTTNNRMELMAVCVALEALKFDGSDVTVYSDSKYVVDAVTKPITDAWAAGEYGEAIGRGTFEAAGVLFGTKATSLSAAEHELGTAKCPAARKQYVQIRFQRFGIQRR